MPEKIVQFCLVNNSIGAPIANIVCGEESKKIPFRCISTAKGGLLT